MQIVSAELFALELPLRRPFVVAYATYTHMPTVLLRLTTDTGITGWGEATPDEHVTGESVPGVLAALEHQLLPVLGGLDPTNIVRLHALMDAALCGNGAAKAAIDIACHDLVARSLDVPVSTLLGGRAREYLPLAKVLSILPPEEVAAQAREAVEAGYETLKLKLGSGPLADDIARVAQVRQAVGADVKLRLDANQGWHSVATARQMIAAIEPYAVEWVEQPIDADSLDGFAALRPHTVVPLMADESITGRDDVARVVRGDLVDLVNLKLMKSGGIRPCHDLATQAALGGLRAQVGSMLESSVGSAAGYQLAFAHPAIESAECSGPIWISDDPGNLLLEAPHVTLNSQSGLGIDVNHATVERLATTQKEVRYS